MCGGWGGGGGGAREEAIIVTTQKEITSQTDLYLVILSSEPYVFEDKFLKSN